MKALHLIFFCLAWEFGFFVYALYQEVTKAKKSQERPVDSQGLTAYIDYQQLTKNYSVKTLEKKTR